MTDLRKQITDDFCSAFRHRADFVGIAARLVAQGDLPEGVDFGDQRVQLIMMLCMVGEALPECASCHGFGYYIVDTQGDACMDCLGTGIRHPCDANDDENGRTCSNPGNEVR